MTFVDQDQKAKYEAEMQRKIQAGEIIPVGFYVDRKRYEEMKKKAFELHSQTQPTGRKGEVERLLDSPDPNHYVSFCVQFFEQNYGIMRQFMNAKDPQAVFKGLVGQIMGAMGNKK